MNNLEENFYVSYNGKFIKECISIEIISISNATEKCIVGIEIMCIDEDGLLKIIRDAPEKFKFVRK